MDNPIFYIVFGATGEYSDHSEWAIAGYIDKELAKQHVLKASQWHNEHHAAWRETYGNDYHAPKELVGDYRCDYSGANFYIVEVELRVDVP
jgi:hypothetical protein